MYKILAIDDQQDNLTTIKAVLKIHIPNAIVFTATSGQEGIEMAEKEQPDVILLDIIMPQMDGYETCKRLKSQEQTMLIPIVMVTAIRTDSESRVKGLELGADAFVSKPIDPIELSAQVKVMLRIKEAEDTLRADKIALEEVVLERTYELKESELKYKALYINAPLSYQSLNKDGYFLDVNPMWLKILGYERNEVIGKNFSDFLHPDWAANFNKSFAFFKKQGFISDAQYKIRHKKGHFLDISFEGAIAYHPDGSVKQTYCVFQDITESKKAKERLIAALDKAKESDRLKSAFLANISHEIRTPMNGILGFANLLKQPELTGEKTKLYIDIINKSGMRMLNIINAIIEISKIEAGQMKVTISPTNVNVEIDEVFDFFKQEVEKKAIDFSYSKALPDTKAIIETDKQKLCAILINLVKNSIKYTDKGSIKLGYEFIKVKSIAELKFYIKDTGIGIPENRQEAIFDRFVQADIEDMEAREGSGLGLSIAKAYIEMLGGKIWLNSEPGIGTDVYFTIPYITIPSKQIEIPEPEIIEKPEMSKNKLKILMVEDDEVAAFYLSEILEDNASTLLHAKTGSEGIALSKQYNDIDLILMDIKMPDMNGYEVTRRIREFDKDVVIIAQTAYAHIKDKQKALEAGCNDYVSKPIIRHELEAKIKNLVTK
ncbi:MAG: response regulator [Bacteroidales bacterium]|nr:response regulator [Bacteroidales bacterium]MCF8390762.1 response regulator [Bacteroidales bacterium]